MFLIKWTFFSVVLLCILQYDQIDPVYIRLQKMPKKKFNSLGPKQMLTYQLYTSTRILKKHVAR